MEKQLAAAGMQIDDESNFSVSVTISVLKVDFESNTIAPALNVLLRYIRTTLSIENLSDVCRNYVLYEESLVLHRTIIGIYGTILKAVKHL